MRLEVAGKCMKCLHCLVEFHPKPREYILGDDADGSWAIERLDCPACERMNLYLISCELTGPSYNPSIGTVGAVTAIRPFGMARNPCPDEVPADLAEDYKEACIVLPHSPKASAAMSRRCLQSLLRGAAKVKPCDLAHEIQEVIDSGRLPSHLVASIDAVRTIGNFGAHPMKSSATGAILPVEPHEAEWTLDVLEGLFDFFFVQPAQTARKRAAMDAKLKEAGKPPMK